MARYGGEISITVLAFILDYFQEKLPWQNFWKNPKNRILGPFWALFAQISTINFPGKKGCQFLNILIIYNCAKNQKKLINHSWEKYWTVGQTDGSDFTGPSLGRGSIIKRNLSFPEFISTHQKPVYSINFFVRYGQLKVLRSEWHNHLWTCPSPILFNQLLISMNLYQHAKKSGFFIILH